MEKGDRERILKVAKKNTQLKRLYSEHMQFERELARYSKRQYLTSDEQLAEAILKRKKLQGVDTMMSLLSTEARSAEAH